MRIIGAIIAAGVAFGLVGNWVIALVIGGCIYWVIGQATSSTTQRVMVEDIQTGRVKIQPMDEATRRYLNTRKDK